VFVCFLTPVFVTLFEEEKWPDDPIDYARKFFGSTPREEIEAAVAENARLKDELKVMEAKIADLQKQLEDGSG
jgi:hypothetical protein